MSLVILYANSIVRDVASAVPVVCHPFALKQTKGAAMRIVRFLVERP